MDLFTSPRIAEVGRWRTLRRAVRPHPRLHRLLGPLLIVAMTMSARSSRAEERRPAVTALVRVQAPESCATSETFGRAIARRTERLRIVGSHHADVTLDVVLRTGDGGAAGNVQIARDGRIFAERRLAGASCDEVTQGLSLIVALAFDPAAKIDVPEEPTETVALVEGSRAKSAMAASAPETRTSAPGADAEQPATETSKRPRWRFGIGGAGTVLGVAAPRAVFGYGGFVDLERDALASRGLSVSPSARAAVLRAEGSAASAGVDAEMAWMLARGSVCPVRLVLASSLALRPCAGIDIGAMTARASRVVRPTERARLWMGGAASLRLAWSPVPAAVLEIEGGASAPFVRDELAVDPNVALYRTPAVVPTGQFAAALHFP